MQLCFMLFCFSFLGKKIRLNDLDDLFLFHLFILIMREAEMCNKLCNTYIEINNINGSSIFFKLKWWLKWGVPQMWEYVLQIVFQINNSEENTDFHGRTQKTDWLSGKNVINYTKKKNRQDRVRSAQWINNINIEKLQGTVEAEWGGAIILKYRKACRREQCSYM